MNKIITIYSIKNGFLVAYANGDYQSFSDGIVEGDQVHMINTILKHLGIRGFKLVTAKGAAQLQLRGEYNARPN